MASCRPSTARRGDGVVQHHVQGIAPGVDRGHALRRSSTRANAAVTFSSNRYCSSASFEAADVGEQQRAHDALRGRFRDGRGDGAGHLRSLPGGGDRGRRPSASSPGRYVDRRPGLAMGPAAIPHAELPDSVEEASAKQQEPMASSEP